MIFADIFMWFLIITGALIVFVAHWLGACALFPRRVDGAAHVYGKRPIGATLVGLLIALPAITVAIVLAKLLPHPIVQIPLIGALLVLGLLSLIGSAGLAQRIGAGLASPLDATQPWRRVLRGGIVLALAFVMPFLGWFVLLPWTIASGLGAFVLASGARAVRLVHAPTVAPVPETPLTSALHVQPSVES